MKNIILVFLVIAAVFEGCKKYEDGPTFSLTSVKNRITGTWTVDKFYINGVDSTDEYIAKLGCEIEFNKEIYNLSNKMWKVFLKDCNNGNILSGQWSFYGDHKQLVHIYYKQDSVFNVAIGPFGQNISVTWTILRLTNKEFNLTSDYFGFDGSGTRNFLLELKK